MNTAVALPTNLTLPAHLQTSEAAAAVAAANAAAGGGIRTGGFPKISIEGSKFHEIDPQIDGGAARTYMVAGAPGQPALPMMCLEAIVVGANPALVKTYYIEKWKKGESNAPDCQSSNGVTPDATVAKPQAAVCATCPQNQWGSKISEASGKDIKACTDAKQLVILPAADLTYKVLGLSVTPAALGDFGKFVKDISGRGIPLPSIVVNITFDHTASFPKLKFAFNRFLTAEEYAQVQGRAQGDDVKSIITPAIRAPQPPALAAPASAALLPQANLAAPAAPVVVPAPAVVPPVVVPAPVVSAPGGFGAAPVVVSPVVVSPAVVPVVPAAARAPRKPRTIPLPAASVDLSHLSPAIRAAVEAMGVDSEGAKAILAQFAPPAVQPVVAAQPIAPVVAAAVASTGGFGATVAAPVVPVAAPVTAAATASGLSLADALRAKLALGPKTA